MKDVLLSPLSGLYNIITRLRNLSYNQGIKVSYQPSVFTLGIGNITVGGTGKTPVTLMLARDFLEIGLKVAIVSRGYKGEFKGVEKVTLGKGSYFGDEATLMAQILPDIPIYVGGNRKEVIQELLQKENKIDIILADDAFQHRRLKCHKMILVVDCMEQLKNYKLLPAGRAREALSGVSRADYIFYNKVNFIEEAELAAVQNKIQNEFIKKGKAIPPVVWLQNKISSFYLMSDPSITIREGGEHWSMFQGKQYALLSGLGRPKSFEYAINQRGINFKKHFCYRDHYAMSLKDVISVKQQCREMNLDAIIVTEKDYVKIKDYDFEMPVWVSQLELEPSEVYYEILNEVNKSTV